MCEFNLIPLENVILLIWFSFNIFIFIYTIYIERKLPTFDFRFKDGITVGELLYCITICLPVTVVVLVTTIIRKVFEIISKILKIKLL